MKGHSKCTGEMKKKKSTNKEYLLINSIHFPNLVPPLLCMPLGFFVLFCAVTNFPV